MTLQPIKSIEGKDEYALLPVTAYKALQGKIEEELARLEAAAEKGEEYVPFVLEDYVDNPLTLARMKALIAQAGSALGRYTSLYQQDQGAVQCASRTIPHEPVSWLEVDRSPSGPIAPYTSGAKWVQK